MPATSSVPSQANSSAQAGSQAAGAVVGTSSGSGGTFLTDGSGKALYLWVADSKNKSVCSGPCAVAWPPLTTKGAPTASGATKAGELGTITRADGSKQVTYDGHALYYYIGDTQAGQTTGQGSNGFGAKWWLVAPSGSAITGGGASGPGSQPAGSPPAPSGPGYGYVVAPPTGAGG
jgi:predicted lipoprotein with Yx(FWY)xxD motif